MAHEIKFRIIHKGRIVGYEHLTDTGWKWNWIELNPDKGERWTKGVIEDSTPTAMIRNQFSGQKDKNDKDIYEGDICKYYDIDKELIGLVEFKEFGFWIGGTRWFCDKTEIIGNIYETPELLPRAVGAKKKKASTELTVIL